MPHQSLYQTVFNHGTTGSDAVKELEQVTREFPYFGLAHFFLLKNIDAGHEDADKIAARTALHFSNPYLLRQQLIKEVRPVTEPKNVVETAETETVLDEQPYEAPEAIIEENFTEEKPEELVKEAVVKSIEPVLEETPIVNKENLTEEIAEEPVTGPVVEIPQPTEPVAVEAPEATFPEPAKVEAKKEELLFEPLYTTDYFASQGIKLSEEVQPTDKLGKQLKSFTEWLKTMKKVHESKLPEGSEQLDASVNKLAEKSNRDEEIITEAMAEAYISQGKPEKAKDVYLKLSLLNPSKNAYFAAKINEIAW